MKLHFDEQADAIYLTLSDADVLESEEVRPGIILDFDANNEVVAIEILRVSRRTPSINPKLLQLEVA